MPRPTDPVFNAVGQGAVEEGYQAVPMALRRSG